MNEKKEQKIIVLTTLSAADKNLILHGIRLASLFKKELCLTYHLTKKTRKNRDKAKLQLNEYLGAIQNEIPVTKISVLLTKEKVSNLPDVLADEHEAILLITRASDYKIYASAVIESPIPFLFVDPEASISAYKKIFLPIDLRKENSDTTLWCSWFGRFGNSEITAVAANDKSRDSNQQVMRNVALAKSLFKKTGVSHKIFKGRKSSFFNSFETSEFALNSEADLLVLLGSSTITPLDRLIGLPERKIISKAFKLPVLLVNPRRDNYILCD